jgi:predicted AAA+ superfamily ATPase
VSKSFDSYGRRDYARSLHCDASTYLFFDEVPNAPPWETYVRRLQDTEDAQIFVTGSSSFEPYTKTARARNSCSRWAAGTEHGAL